MILLMLMSLNGILGLLLSDEEEIDMTKVYEVYAAMDDMTFIMKEDTKKNEIILDVAGFYFGEPEAEATKDFVDKKFGAIIENDILDDMKQAFLAGERAGASAEKLNGMFSMARAVLTNLGYSAEDVHKIFIDWCEEVV